MSGGPARRTVLAGLSAAAALGGAAAASTFNKRTPAMRIKDVFVLLCTDRLYECRDFYVRTFGFTVSFQSSIYIQLHHDGAAAGPGFSLALMPPDHPFGPTFAGAFDGRGAYVTLQVEDAAATLAAISDRGAPVIQPLRDEAWGQRHFVTRDPGGAIIDVVQDIDPAPGFYDRYPPAR